MFRCETIDYKRNILKVRVFIYLVHGTEIIQAHDNSKGSGGSLRGPYEASKEQAGKVSEIFRRGSHKKSPREASQGKRAFG